MGMKKVVQKEQTIQQKIQKKDKTIKEIKLQYKRENQQKLKG
jgi:hypothetical protein